MPRPGTEILIREVPEPRSAPTDTGVWYIAGLTERGDVAAPVAIESISDYLRLLGNRVSYGLLYDALDTFFHEGGHRAYVSRVVGPAKVSATRNLLDGSAGISLVVTAANPGDWGNNISVGVGAGSSGGLFVIIVQYNGVEVERSSDLADTAAAVAWSQFSDYIRLTQGASSNDPATLSPAALSTGTDDRGNVADSDWATALARFSMGLGPGQISAPGQTTTARHNQLLGHAVANNRVALIDLPNSNSKATLKAAALSLSQDDRWGGAWGTWLTIPGILQGTTRTAPPSAMIAGLIARNDVSRSPNVAAAGEMGQSVYVLGLAQPEWSDPDRTELNDAGVNVVKSVFGSIRNYGFRTLADPVTNRNWINLGASRLIMAIKAQGINILERFVFDEIDGRGRLFAELAGQLTSMCKTYYDLGSLYGATPGEAFAVDTGPKVNTPETIYNNELHALLSLRVSPMAEWVVLELVKVPTLEAVA